MAYKALVEFEIGDIIINNSYCTIWIVESYKMSHVNIITCCTVNNTVKHLLLYNNSIIDFIPQKNTKTNIYLRREYQ